MKSFLVDFYNKGNHNKTVFNEALKMGNFLCINFLWGMFVENEARKQSGVWDWKGLVGVVVHLLPDILIRQDYHVISLT